MVKSLTVDLLDWMYQSNKEWRNEQGDMFTKFNFLANMVFGLCTYDEIIEDEWGQKIFEVLKFIQEQESFTVINNLGKYEQFLLVCQLLKQRNWIEWGTSIRSCWFDENQWSEPVMIEMLGVPVDDERYDEDGIAWSVDNLKVLLEWLEK